ncbi:MAG: hypothetical protein PHR45_07340 [Muribaculaceae bacterium]|nr:hypothetical protein [Muribaculaceae bacterium]
MKKVILIFALIIATVTSAMAQKTIDPAKGQEIFNAKVKFMQENLLLSAEQTEQFIPIYRKYIDGIRALKHPSRKAECKTVDESYNNVMAGINFKRSILDLQETAIKELKSVLNAQQLGKFINAERQMQDKIKGFKDKKKNGEKGKGKKQRQSQRPTEQQD